MPEDLMVERGTRLRVLLPVRWWSFCDFITDLGHQVFLLLPEGGELISELRGPLSDLLLFRLKLMFSGILDQGLEISPFEINLALVNGLLDVRANILCSLNI
jgi:hypothetical protein